MLKFCPIIGCYRLAFVRIEYNGIYTAFSCHKHIHDVEMEIRKQIIKNKKLKCSCIDDPVYCQVHTRKLIDKNFFK
jgi:hypothetical protein